MENTAFKVTISLVCIFSFYPAIAQLETYIVHLALPDDQVFTRSEDLDSWYQSFLPASTTSSNEQSRMVYTYHNVFTGFAARLSSEEAKAMEMKEGFLSSRREEVLPLHTTHSPAFLGLNQTSGFWRDSNFGEGVIIGVLDTGIAPNHPSFSDEGMPPPPARWQGRCEFNIAACNNKLIGARSSVSPAEKPFDHNGHGTHVAGIAAGNFVEGANVLGQAYGTAVGMAPRAHLAIYKVCSASAGCAGSAILAGIDAAVGDGVDMLCISLGAPSSAFYLSSLAIGTFGAVQRGVFVSCSAGNRGPSYGSLSNEAPWVLTVGASTIDRSIMETALLGNKDVINGESLFQPNNFSSSLLPLVYAGMNGDPNAALCLGGSLNSTDVRGKIVLCESDRGFRNSRAKGQTVNDAGGAAMIIMNQEPEGYTLPAEAHVLPAIHVSYADGLKIKAYIYSTSTPTGTILFNGTRLGGAYAPTVASTSSRGPNQESPGILKPDIIGPGVNILAAWFRFVENNPNTMFTLLSGTSMAAPHLIGIASLLKSVHPDWSPAVIKSAIMTTVNTLNLGGMPIVDERLIPASFFAMGAGHVNPSRANDPGLVYDIQPDDYISYLCGLRYTDQQVGIIAQRMVRCSQVSTIPEAQLNYPSFSITLGRTRQIYTRTVTNVGEANSSYTVELDPPPGVGVSVTPNRLDFSEVNQQITYQVTFSQSSGGPRVRTVEGSLRWTSIEHVVRSPISVRLVSF